MVKSFPEYRIYKPKKDGKGAASRLQFRIIKKKYGPEVLLFWQFVQQIGFKDDNAAFGWNEPEKTITMKLGEPDIGDLLAVFCGLKDFTGSGVGKGLFHQNANGNTVLNVNRQEKEGFLPSYYVKASAQKKNLKITLAIQHTLTLGEGAIIRILLEQALKAMYDWNIRDTRFQREEQTESSNQSSPEKPK